jgi:hypothetical protein
LNHENINHLNKCITCDEIETVIKSLPAKEEPRIHGFTTKFCQTFKKELTPILLKPFLEIERERTLPNSFHEA